MKTIGWKKKKGLVVFALAVFLVATFFIFQSLEFSKGAPATATDQVNLSVTVEETISLSCGADVSLGTLTAGTPVSASTVCTTTTNAEAGYHLAVKRDDPDTTMDHASDATTNITDKTAWALPGPGVAYSGTGLAFRVYAVSSATKNNTWWGTDTACPHTVPASALYAGFPTSYVDIMEHDSYNSGSSTVSICYRLDVPSTQKSGSYTGSVTYQVTSGP